MNKEQLVAAVADDSGVDARTVHRVLSSLFDTVVRTVADGDDVAITNFGTWRAVDCPERLAHNPRTMQRIAVPARRMMRFRVSPTVITLVGRGISTYAGVPITVAKRNKGNTAEITTVANVKDRF